MFDDKLIDIFEWINTLDIFILIFSLYFFIKEKTNVFFKVAVCSTVALTLCDWYFSLISFTNIREKSYLIVLFGFLCALQIHSVSYKYLSLNVNKKAIIYIVLVTLFSSCLLITWYVCFLIVDYRTIIILLVVIFCIPFLCFQFYCLKWNKERYVNQYHYISEYLFLFIIILLIVTLLFFIFIKEYKELMYSGITAVVSVLLLFRMILLRLSFKKNIKDVK